MRKRDEEQNEAQAGVQQQPHEERREHGDPDGLRLHKRLLQATIHESRDFLRPLENPVEVVKGEEMKSDGAGGRDGVLPSADVREYDVILVHAHHPINATNKRREKQIQWWNGEPALGQFGMQYYGHNFRKDRHDAENVANP